MIIYFFDRFWNPLGKASATLPNGVNYYGDQEIEDVEQGTATFSVNVGFDEENRHIVKAYGQEAVYFITTDQEGNGRLWSVIDDESDEAEMFHSFYGEDAGMDLINEMLPVWGSPGSAKPIVYYVEKAAADSGFEIGINEIPNLTRTLDWDGEATALNRLQSILTQFDNAELQFRFDIDENTLELKHKYIDILKKRGNDTGIELRMNREVKNIRMKRSRANMFNAYRCYGATPEGKENPITLTGYSLTTEQKEINPETGKARFVLSGNILKDTESNAKYSRYTNPYEQGEDEGYYTGIYSSEATTQYALASETILQLKKTGYPEVNYEVDVIDAPRTLKAGDYVSIVNDKDELYLEGRILKTNRSRSNDTFEITLGDYLIRDSGIAEQIQAMADKLKGKDGVSNFIFYAYADDDKGTGFSLNPQGKKYTGLTVSLVNQQPSDPSVYTWSLSKGDDGQPGEPGETFYPHTAWMMADGTFTKFYPHENELPNSKSPKFSAYSGSSMTYTENVSVPEWGATDAVQHKVSGGTYETISGLLAAGNLIDLNTKYVHSMYIKNIGTTVVRISNNLDRTLEVAPNETKRLIYAPASKDSGRAAKQFTLYRLNSTDVQEFIVWHAKIEKSDSTATIWTPMPSEDPVNAYPRYEGTYSDNNVEGSDNPSDYEPWKQIKGEDGKDIFIHRAWKMADGTFTPNYPSDNMLSNSQLTSTKDWGFGGGLTYELKEGGEILLIKTANTGSRTFFSQNIPLASIKRKTQYSIYIEIFVESASGANVGNTEVFLRTVANGPYIDSPRVSIDLTKINQWQVLQITGTSYDGQLTAAQFTLAISQDVVARIRVRKPKLAEGTTAFPYTPKPSEDPVNAYPKYAGEYSDHNETASSNPDDYEPWQVIRGEEGVDGQDAKEVFSGYLTNEAIVLPASAAGTVTDFSKANGTFVMFLGQEQLSSGVTYSLESATGITTTINETSGAYSVTAISADMGVAIYKATYNDVTIRKQLMVVKARQGANGANGANGVGVTDTTITYQAGSSGTTAPTGTWTATIPSVTASQYLWTRTVWTFSDGISKTGYSVGKMGENGAKGDTGATGATGNGIASAAIAYANSTSGTTIPTSGWVTTIPSVPAGNFLWTRTVFTYTGGGSSTSYAVAKQGEQGNPTGIISQNTVPAAADRYVGMLWKNTGASGYINGATYRWNGSAFELYIFVAENISVSNLAAISANLGTITAGTIIGITINGSKFVNSFSYADGGVTYTGSTIVEDGNVTIARTGSDGSTWTTTMDRVQGFVDTYKVSSSAPARTTQLGQGKLYMVESGVGGYLPAAALNPASWTNLSYASGFTTAENNPCQYRKVQIVDGSWELQLRGQIKPTSGDFSTTASPTGGILPAGFRPIRNELVPAADSTKKGARVVVLADGQIQLNTPNGGNYVSFGGIRIAL